MADEVPLRDSPPVGLVRCVVCRRPVERPAGDFRPHFCSRTCGLKHFLRTYRRTMKKR